MIVPDLFRIARALAPTGELYMMVDPARSPSIHRRLVELDHAVRAQSMYQGEIGADLGHVLPWLVHLPHASAASCWFAETGFGQSWGSFVITDVTFDALRRHLRKFNLVTSADGRERVFRFYDPRVLRRFLPEASSSEAVRFFGAVRAFITETDDADTLLQFALVDGAVRATPIAVGAPMPARLGT